MDNNYFRNLLHKEATSNLAEDSVFAQKKKSAKLKYLAELASLRADRLDDKLKEEDKAAKEKAAKEKANTEIQPNMSLGGTQGAINPAFPLSV